MLPFIKKKDVGGIASTIIKQREPDEQPTDSDTPYTIVDCCKDILHAINTNDAEGLAEALKEAISKASEPEETPEPHSYDSQAGE